MALLNQELQDQLRDVFSSMKEDVTLAVFTKEGECYSCEETMSYMREIEALSDKIHVEALDIEKNADAAEQYQVKMVPSIVLLDANKAYVGIKFNGIPAGHEINSFIPGILEVSGAGEPMPPQYMEALEALNKPVNIKVFVTLSCPHCAGAVQKAHKLALESKWIDAEMVEAQTFDALSNQFNVSSVPKVVINDTYEFVGNQSIDVFLSEIQKTQI